jgi:cytochrome c oxidase subunit 2
LAQTVKPKSVDLGPGFWLVTAFLALLSVAAAIFWITVPTPMGVEQAADTAYPTDVLFKVLAVIGSALFIYVAGYIVYFAIVFQRPKGAPANTIGVQVHDAPVLEFWWTVIPAIIVLGLAIASVQLLSKIYNTAGDVLTMEAIGYQFGFQFRYPKLPAPVAEMHIPVDTPVTVHVTARDVIHGFWIPEIRVKQDMVPGLINTVRFTPTKIGTYPIICTSYCGIAHGGMHAVVHVDSQQDFAKWFASQQTGGGAAGAGSAAGAAIALTSGSVSAGQVLFGQKCSACHSLGPFTQKIVGPGLGHIFDDSDHPKLVNGTAPSPQNIAMILKNGYQGDIGVMPSSQVNQINNTDIANLTAYLVSLSKK